MLILLPLADDKWSVKAITWLMVQIWFGNTYLSFAQAESFHPIFGPILMTMFAALSNTLLLTSESLGVKKRIRPDALTSSLDLYPV